MQLALIGYGKMGQSIYQTALSRGHQVIGKFNTKDALDNDVLRNAVCIDFTSPKAFRANYKIIADHCKAIVVGTTGWEDIQPEVLDYFRDKKKTLIYASNFSVGANIYFKTIKVATKLFAVFGEYDPYVIEMHHREKKDAPSGTAKTIVAILQQIFNKKVIPVSVRSGWIRGVHEVGYESVADKVTIKHEAYTRDGFAAGAVLAAEWIDNVSGVWNFQDLLETKFQQVLKCND